MENMEQVFEQCQQFEEKRLRFFREVLLEVQKHLDLSNVASYKTIYRELEQSIKAADGFRRPCLTVAQIATDLQGWPNYVLAPPAFCTLMTTCQPLWV
ncbi:protein kinase C and casein kinase substrate in neurons protein 2-like [Peromyscus maniculatus bairdii]|uniref:protein kinase C and casein kinase substrate in neurons protein 2-like n=1 Tax=Peromyscus maniculatus bairdii TaxID=230844 RepID=UPI00077DD9A3|nr:protein kinase C and casein kinase substrate in neurons protein 2-like [Peromyscus maniculatus bairdii]